MIRTCPSHTLPLSTLALFAAALPAQSAQPVPANADLADAHQSHGLPFGVPGFRTQILVDPFAVAPTTAILTGIAFRADRSSAPLAGGVVPNVTISLSHCTQAVGALSETFALNVTGTPTVVFQGSVTLPPQTPGNAGPMPWNIDVQFPVPFVFSTVQGSLLIDIVGNNAGGGFPSYYLDAAEGGGAVTQFGRGGDNPSFDFLNLIASTGPDLDPRRVAPGNTIEYHSTLSFTSPPGVLMLGLVPVTPPLDLGFVGAPTHTLYVDPAAFFVHSWQQSFIGWFSTQAIAIPADPSFLSLRLYAQSVLFDPAANAAGLVMSHALETLIGDGNVPLPMQQVDANDPAAATGTILDFSFSPTPRFGAVPIQLQGSFF
jgi:hypothetical protein